MNRDILLSGNPKSDDTYHLEGTFIGEEGFTESSVYRKSKQKLFDLYSSNDDLIIYNINKVTLINIEIKPVIRIDGFFYIQIS